MIIKKHPNFNLYPEPYCIAKYENGKVICYEGDKVLGLADGVKEDECKHCPQLTEALDKMMKEK